MQMDIKKGKLNIRVSLAFKIMTMLAAIATRMCLVASCGNDVNGLNALYISVIGFLSVAELGIGTAITFCMYQPIVEGATERVAALYHLFRKLYLLIGSIIFVGGLAVLPFLKYLAKDYRTLDVNMYLTFFLMLLSVVLTYLFSAKLSLINAYKNNYLSTAITQGGMLLQYVLQMIVLLITQSFAAFLLCRIIALLPQWLITEVVTRKKHGDVIAIHARPDAEIQKAVKKNVAAMFMHKIGDILVNTADSVIISIFMGVAALGEYANYTLVLSSMLSVLALVFTPLTSVLGHLYAEESKKTVQAYADSLHLLNFMLGAVFFLGYYAVIDHLIALLFPSAPLLLRSVSFVITLNGFVQFLRHSTLIFRDATGTFYHDRWKPLAEGLLNVILSVLFVKLFGVVGVIAATAVTNLLICHTVEPYVLYKHAFSVSPRKYYIKNYGMILAFSVTLVGMHFCLRSTSHAITALLINGLISLGFSSVLCILVLVCNRQDGKRLLKIFREG